MSINLNFQRTCGLVFFFIAVLLGTAYILEYFFQYLPCPLCLLQRYVFWVIGAAFLIAILHNPKGWGQLVYSILILLFANLGLILAGRQIWLQHQPPELIPSCLASLDNLLQFYPVLDAFKMAFKGSSECTEGAPFLGLSLATWSLMAFIAIELIALFIIFRQKKGGT